jgi:predicted NAD-dependent protein-ADP-ribosyltransferase YbiA (DUF1768 family)
MEKYIGFTKVALPYGWLGNMSPHPVFWGNKVWRTSEALFQAMRFDDETIKDAIQAEKSPMGAKFKAKSYRERITVVPLSDQDIKNMEFCVKLKLDNYPELRTLLKATGDAILFEDVSSRPRGNNMVWGAILIGEELIGENKLGQIWMELRANL